MDNEKIKFAAKIREIRKSLSFSQAEFAKQLGVSQAYVKDIEIQRCLPSRNFLVRLRRKYGVSIDALIDGDQVKRKIELRLKVNDKRTARLIKFKRSDINPEP